MRRTRIIFGGVLIAAFVYMGLGAFKETLTPYVSFAEARATVGKSVQVTGDLTEAHTYWYSSDASRVFHFLMVEVETGDTLQVAYDGVKPSTFDEATGIVAIGSFDGSLFYAKQILTKCPSKYEGQDPAEHEKSFGREKGQPGFPADLPR
jgi:cytochrome c-type biogenesis protein CcmE